MKKHSVNKIKGAAMIEYVLIVGLIAAGAILALTGVGTALVTFFTNLTTTISGV